MLFGNIKKIIGENDKVNPGEKKILLEELGKLEKLEDLRTLAKKMASSLTPTMIGHLKQLHNECANETLFLSIYTEALLSRLNIAFYCARD